MRLNRFLLCGFLSLGVAFAASPGFPENPKDLKTTIPFGAVVEYLGSIAKPGVEVREIGRSAGGRPLLLVHMNRGGAKATFRVLWYAQQHGNEVSGKDALMYLIREYVDHPERLPEDVDLYVVPVYNPDGAVSNRRTNDAKADLNRDHLLLSQPETQAFHRMVSQIQPHLAADCHEFTRDNEDYRKLGWERWPIITLDSLNHLLIPQALREAGLEKVATSAPAMQAAGIPYARYAVGGPPPEEELRPSTLEADDGRNSLGTEGVLSFIIEAGIRREAKDPQADLGLRVVAYLKLFDHLLGTSASRSQLLALSQQARVEPLPAFIATNAFWGNVQGKVAQVKVVEPASGKILEIPTASQMQDVVVKGSVPTPRAYAVEPWAVGALRPLLERHGITFKVLDMSLRRRLEACRLLRVEPSYDELYQRYENRQIVMREPMIERELPVGTMVIDLDQPMARRAIQVLEPCLLYGLFSYPEFNKLPEPGGRLPILRLF